MISEEEQLIKEKIEDLKEYLEYGMSYSEYLDVVNAFEYIESKFKEKEKIIKLMAEQLVGLAIWNNEKEEPIILGSEEEVIEHFKAMSEKPTEGE